jgi:hypothetical protein
MRISILFWDFPILDQRLHPKERFPWKMLIQFKKILFFDSPKSRLSIQYIESILTREYSFPMTEAAENAFKVAAVIFTMVNFMLFKEAASGFQLKSLVA